MAKSTKGNILVSGLQYPIPFLCSQIAKLTGAGRPVKFFHVAGGGRFKVGNRTVATYDGTRIRAASGNKVLALPDPPEPPGRSVQRLPPVPEEMPAFRDEEVFHDMPRPTDPDDINKYVDEMLAMYEYDGAMRYVEDILGKDPGNADAISQRCTILYLQGGSEESINEIRAALRRMPGNTTLAWRLYALQYIQGLYEDAIRSIDEYMRMDGGNLSARMARLHTLIKCNRFSDAMDAVEAEMNVPLQKIAEDFEVGVDILLEGVDWSEPIDAADPPDVDRFEEMHMVVRARMIELYTIKSHVLSGMKRYEEALDTIDFVLGWEERGEIDHLRYNRAKIMADAGQKIEALEYYDEHHVGESRAADSHRGRLLAEMGKHEEALPYLRRAMHMAVAGNSEDAEMAASSLIVLGRFKEAKEYAGRALRIYPGSKKAREIKAKAEYLAKSGGKPDSGAS